MSRVGEVALDCREVTLRYGDTDALRSVDLRLAPGETVAVLGPSGSGKTTLLYAIAGFLPVVHGEIRIDGALVSSSQVTEPPERRPVGMVFQHYGLWPHMDALATVAYPLRRSGASSADADDTARQLLDQLSIGHLADRQPAELSGGEQQRVGLARALARRPALYLLDEPTAHLDTVLKTELQQEIATRMRADGAAAIHATHDVDDAMSLADRIVLLRDGSIVQSGVPHEVYAKPVDEWAAQLTGPASFIEGTLTADVDGRTFASDGTRWALGGASQGAEGGLGDASAGRSRDHDPDAGGSGRYLVRPDWVDLGGPIDAVVGDVRYRGSHTDYRLDTALGPLRLNQRGAARLRSGEATSCSVRHVWRMPGDR